MTMTKMAKGVTITGVVSFFASIACAATSVILTKEQVAGNIDFDDADINQAANKLYIAGLVGAVASPLITLLTLMCMEKNQQVNEIKKLAAAGTIEEGRPLVDLTEKPEDYGSTITLVIN